MTSKKNLLSSLSFILTAHVLLASATAHADANMSKEFTLVPGVTTEIYKGLGASETRVTFVDSKAESKTPVQSVQCSVKNQENTTPIEGNSVLAVGDDQVFCTLALSDKSLRSAAIQVTYTVSRKRQQELPELDALDDLKVKLMRPLFHTHRLVDEVAPKYPQTISEQIISLDSKNPKVVIQDNAPENQLYVFEYVKLPQENSTLICDSQSDESETPEIFARGRFGYKTYRTHAPSSRIACSVQSDKKLEPITLKIRQLNITAALAEIDTQESSMIAQANEGTKAQEKSEIAGLETAVNQQIATNNQRIQLYLLQEKLHARELELAEKNQEIAKIYEVQNRVQQEHKIAARLMAVVNEPKTSLSETDWKLVLNYRQTESQKAQKRIEELNQSIQKKRESFAKDTQTLGLVYTPEKEMNGFTPEKRVLKTRLLKRHYTLSYTPVKIVIDGHVALKTGLKITDASQILSEDYSQFSQKTILASPDSMPANSIIVTSSNWPENGSLSKEKIEIDTCWNQDPNFKSVFSDLKQQRSQENLRPSIEEAVARIQASVLLGTSGLKKSKPDCRTPSPNPKDIIGVDLVRGPVTQFCYLAETREKNYDGYDRRNEIVLIPHRIKTEYMVYGNSQVIRYRDVKKEQTRSYEVITDSIKGVWNNLYASTLGEEKDVEIHPFFKTVVNTGLEHHEGLKTSGEICVPSETGFPKSDKNGAVYGALDAYLAHAYGH